MEVFLKVSRVLLRDSLRTSRIKVPVQERRQPVPVGHSQQVSPVYALVDQGSNPIGYLRGPDRPGTTEKKLGLGAANPHWGEHVPCCESHLLLLTELPPRAEREISAFSIYIYVL